MKMCCIYFILDFPKDEPSFTAAFIKALPVLSLAWLVWLQGVTYGIIPDHLITYNRWILRGLLFSALGDVFLVWQEVLDVCFAMGMTSFAFTQLCYIAAFKIHPIGVKEFFFCAVGLGAFVKLFPCELPDVLSYMVPMYSTLLVGMVWRAFAGVTFNGTIPWRRVFSAVGAVLFVVSDGFIVLNKFCFSLPFERYLIMVTYYAAQLGISLSVINVQRYLEVGAPRASPRPASGHTPTGSVEGSVSVQ